MVNNFKKFTGLPRKAATRLLHQPVQPRTGKRRGRPGKYGTGDAEALRVVWAARDRLCSRRLHPFFPEMIRVLRQHGEQRIDAATEAQLCRMSPSTIERPLSPSRRLCGRRGLHTTRPGSLLK